ncbi:MAG: hypothetical protein JW719_11115 [Pirellulales bacterium]|nr:hypothetical protein [Pirellulales bacterium]
MIFNGLIVLVLSMLVVGFGNYLKVKLKEGNAPEGVEVVAQTSERVF